MKDILVVADIYPFPYNTGGKLRTANLIIQLSKYYNVDFVCFSLDSIEIKQIKQAKEYCRNVFVHESVMPSKIKKIVNLLSKSCNAEFIVNSNEMKQTVRELTHKYSYKAVVVERLYAYQYVKDVVKAPILLDMHDIEREAMDYFSKIAKNPLQKLHYKIETHKVIQLEKTAVSHVAKMITVSERDKEIYLQYFSKTKEKWFSVNNGIDLSKALDTPVTRRDDRTAIFVGSLRHPPNMHGLRWFVTNAWPPIVKKYSDARFVIVGSGEISDEDKTLFASTTGVEFEGFVENLYPLLRKATCLVVPLFSGSGTRLKILEAFSFHLPVVSTTVGAEGLPYTNGRDIIIENEADGMKDGISRIFDDKEYAESLADAAYGLVAIDYNWDEIGTKLVREIENLGV